MKDEKGNFEEQMTGNEPVGFAKPGEKLTTLEKIQKYVEKNNKMVMGVAIGVIAITAIFFIAKHFISKGIEASNTQASVSLSRVLPFYQVGEFQTALDGDPQNKVRGQEVIGLKKIAEEFSGTDAGKTAALFAGNCYLGMFDYKSAMKYFEMAAKSESDLVKEGANAGLGACSSEDNKLDDAVKYYEKASTLAITPAEKQRYMLYAGLVYEKKNDKEKAEKFFREILNDMQRTEFTGMAKAGLTRLGMIID